jgi:RNA polymerase sigma-70 factor, ECF subfamily
MPTASPTPSAGAPPGISAEALVALHSDMLRFAKLQLRDTGAAEDAVQEAIEAVLRQSGTFAGQASVKTWVFAILKNKIIDHVRQSRRTTALSSLVEGDGDADEDQMLERYFTEHGRWTPEARPTAWPDPEESMSSRQFWRVLEACLERLPRTTARVFMMREFLGFDSGEICDQLSITPGNCHVMLHRARLKLRDCIEKGWGRPGDGKC